MRYIITGKNIKVTEKLKSQIYEKFDKLDKYFAEETTAYVMLSVQKQMQKIEVTIPIKGHTIRAEQSSDDMYASIDGVEEIIVRQIRKYKTKLARHNRQDFQPAFMEAPEEVPDEEIDIIRTKKLAVKPMTPEEACVEMELLGHNFYVFRNADSNNINVVYKRKDNAYGLIETED